MNTACKNVNIWRVHLIAIFTAIISTIHNKCFSFLFCRHMPFFFVIQLQWSMICVKRCYIICYQLSTSICIRMIHMTHWKQLANPVSLKIGYSAHGSLLILLFCVFRTTSPHSFSLSVRKLFPSELHLWLRKFRALKEACKTWRWSILINQCEETFTRYPNSLDLDVFIFVLTTAMLVAYVHYDNVRCFPACEWDMRLLNAVSDDAALISPTLSHSILQHILSKCHKHLHMQHTQCAY